MGGKEVGQQDVRLRGRKFFGLDCGISDERLTGRERDRGE